jgi:hypothetical protein
VLHAADKAIQAKIEIDCLHVKAFRYALDRLRPDEGFEETSVHHVHDFTGWNSHQLDPIAIVGLWLLAGQGSGGGQHAGFEKVASFHGIASIRQKFPGAMSDQFPIAIGPSNLAIPEKLEHPQGVFSISSVPLACESFDVATEFLHRPLLGCLGCTPLDDGCVP